HHAAQRLLGQEVVADLVGHGQRTCRNRQMLTRAGSNSIPCQRTTHDGVSADVRKWRLLLPGASEPRLTAPKTARACRLGYPNRLRGLSNRSIVVVCNYESGPITAEPCRAKARPLRPRRSCFAPAQARRLGWAWVEAPGTAPGSERFI